MIIYGIAQGGNAMLFKTELTEVSAMEEMDKIVKALSAQGIDATVKTVDLMSGGLLENRRSSGTFGMNAEVRFVYKIYVKRAELESAKRILATI
jgi:hypothetical protein